MDDHLFNKWTVFYFYLSLVLLFVVIGVEVVEELSFHVPDTATVIATLLKLQLLLLATGGFAWQSPRQTLFRYGHLGALRIAIAGRTATDYSWLWHHAVN